ncbi:hypothetical protein BAJUN_01620 [Bajunvirus bajun]|uniref:Terminase small subunit n=1 Tax=Brevundimonas phage vB_BgoS-Bajun TaxID=2948594 RepID=A0A9E7N730_9CAUD|nr:hypothetical protein BAJUN_01620 [Brevundimonas phage vB_BgoS-Bajun]
MSTVTPNSLPNPRHELFARLRAKGANVNKAGIAAGFAQGSSTPSELEKSPEVQARIDEIKIELQDARDATRAAAVEAGRVVGQSVGVGKAFVIQKLVENAQMAAQDGDYKESNAALKLIGDELGMFTGGSATPKEDEDGVRSIDMDALDALADAGRAGLLPGEAAEKAASSRNIDPEVAMDLIKGHGTAKSRRADRKLSLGSETDVALTMEEEEARAIAAFEAFEAKNPPREKDPAEEPQAGPDEDGITWTPVDPKTSPEDLIAMALGDKPIVRRDEPTTQAAPADDDRPPRRSRG